MQTLKIFLLQNPTVQWGESPIQLHRRNARNLLFYLALKAEDFLVVAERWGNITFTVTSPAFSHG